MEIGEKIRQFGAQRFSSVKEFAQALGIPAPTLQIYMRGESGPGPRMLIRLRKLGCDLNWLFDEEASSADAPAIFKELNKLKEENKDLRLRLGKIDKLIK